MSMEDALGEFFSTKPEGNTLEKLKFYGILKIVTWPKHMCETIAIKP